jgi:hypothetical protein
MDIVTYPIEFKDARSLSTEIRFYIACERVAGRELLNIRPADPCSASRFINAATRLLRTMKRSGAIQLYVFESELADSEKTESVFLLNKYPVLASRDVSETGIYVKL